MHDCLFRITAALFNVIFECLNRRNYIEIWISSKICEELGHAFLLQQLVSYVFHCVLVFLAAYMMGPLTFYQRPLGAVRSRIHTERFAF